MACWSVDINHEKNQNYLTGRSFILSAGQLCGSLCVAYADREWVYESVEDKPSNEQQVGCIFGVYYLSVSVWMTSFHARLYWDSESIWEN